VREEALQLAQNLDNALSSLHATGATDVAAVASIGLAPFTHGDSPQQVLTVSAIRRWRKPKGRVSRTGHASIRA
jgi:hypothetical protein